MNNQPIISLVLPTRSRVPLVKRLFQSIIENTRCIQNIEVILYVDEDDKESHSIQHDTIPIQKIIGPQCSMGNCNTACLGISSGRIIILINDDMVIRTPDWDDRIIEMDALFSDHIYLAYCNDLFKHAWCTFPILSRHTCDLLIEPYPALYQGAFIDTHLFDLFKRLEHIGYNRIHYLKDVVFEHLHYRTGKADFDNTYQKRSRFGDDSAFIALSKQRSFGANRLIAEIQNKSFLSSTPKVVISNSDKNFFKELYIISKSFLFDTELPIRWRGFLCYWFLGRYLAKRGLLRPFIKPV